MRTFLLLYQTDFEAGDDRHMTIPGRSIHSECRAFTLLASVSSYWHKTLTGWPQSSTPLWVKHQLKKLIECECVKLCITLFFSTGVMSNAA